MDGALTGAPRRRCHGLPHMACQFLAAFSLVSFLVLFSIVSWPDAMPDASARVNAAITHVATNAKLAFAIPGIADPAKTGVAAPMEAAASVTSSISSSIQKLVESVSVFSGLPRAFTPQDLAHFTCPRGDYLNTSVTSLAEKDARLQSYVLRLLHRGYEVMPGWEMGVKLAADRIWTHGDPMWPKPAHCKERWGAKQAVFNDCVMTWAGRLLDAPKHQLMMRLIPRAGSTPILSYARAHFNPKTMKVFDTPAVRQRLELCIEGTHVPPLRLDYGSNPHASLVRVVVNMRDPWERLVSAFAALHTRAPNIIKAQARNRKAPSDRFLELLRVGFDCADYTWARTLWGPAFEEFLPAIGFLALPRLRWEGQKGVYLDRVLRFENLADELVPTMDNPGMPLPPPKPAAVTRLGKVKPVPRGKGKGKVAKGPLVRPGLTAQSPLMGTLRETMAEHPEVMRIFCQAFMQDHICFDYPLPDKCFDVTG
eukprot:jgi/Mesvir1/4772/Mv22188-RA.1